MAHIRLHDAHTTFRVPSSRTHYLKNAGRTPDEGAVDEPNGRVDNGVGRQNVERIAAGQQIGAPYGKQHEQVKGQRGGRHAGEKESDAH